MAIAAIGLLAAVRAIMLYRRGVRPLAIDSQRTLSERALELSMVALFVFWLYLIIDYATGRGPWWVPARLDRVLVEPWPPAAAWFGAALLAIGVALYALAGVAMGDSWRMGIDRQSHEQPPADRPATLVTTGVFAWSRNPIYLGFDLILIGALLIHGRMILTLVCIALELLLHFQILREERLLAGWYGERFDEYRRRVGRYGPWG